MDHPRCHLLHLLLSGFQSVRHSHDRTHLPVNFPIGTALPVTGMTPDLVISLNLALSTRLGRKKVCILIFGMTFAENWPRKRGLGSSNSSRQLYLDDDSLENDCLKLEKSSVVDKILRFAEHTPTGNGSSMSSDDAQILQSNADGKYTVVARRYRPKNFTELVGQETVSQALSTAITSGRVGHAYLFTGARGVGKTSTARIFAKALNAPGGPTPDPALDSDVAIAIDSGEDMDVIEIDGASNRGIEEIRQLRANVNVRPSRSRYKIYIIDEVHMLTVQAFNALLKTLEEPPEHVKFIFCTTDPEKIPITVLSRCQRFDFAPVQADKILERLKFICEREGAHAEEDALKVIARRANGSMRDSQSLLEQILSFSAGRIDVEQVNQILGAADETMLRAMIEAMVNRDSAKSLQLLEQAIATGVDAGQFGEQLLGYMRDLMVLSVGAPSDLIRTASIQSEQELRDLANRWGTSTMLAAIQLLDECLIKMRHSIQSRVLLEVALVQISQLQDLQRISELIAMLQASGEAPRAAASEKKNAESSVGTQPFASPKALGPSMDQTPRPSDSKGATETLAPSTSPSHTPPASSRTLEASPSNPSVTQPSQPLPTSSVSPTGNATSTQAPPVNQLSSRPSEKVEMQVDAGHRQPAAPHSAIAGNASTSNAWTETLNRMDGLVSDYARIALRGEPANDGSWRIVFPQGSELAIEYCERPENRAIIQSALSQTLQRPVVIAFIHSHEAPPQLTFAQHAPKAVSQAQLIRSVAENEFVQTVRKVLGGDIEKVDAAPVAKPPATEPPPQPHAPRAAVAQR